MLVIKLDTDDFVDNWLTSIHGHSRIKGAGSIPIILVGTHTDQLRMINLDTDDIVDIWLTSIHGHSRIKGAGSTPIILVCSHTDQLSPVSIFLSQAFS